MILGCLKIGYSPCWVCLWTWGKWDSQTTQPPSFARWLQKFKENKFVHVEEKNITALDSIKSWLCLITYISTQYMCPWLIWQKSFEMAAGKVMFFVGNGQLGFTSNIQQSIMADSQSHIFQTMFAMFMSTSKTWTIIGQKDQHIPKSLENEPCIFSLFTQARLRSAPGFRWKWWIWWRSKSPGPAGHLRSGPGPAAWSHPAVISATFGRKKRDLRCRQWCYIYRDI